MLIKSIVIQPEISVKIFEKHNVLQDEIYDVLKHNKPTFKKVSGNQYVAVGLSRSRHITIYFNYDKNMNEAEITTAYPSDKRQIRAYKRMNR